ncbi:MAG: TnpV protein [Clostridia bacterium]|nr:TnpV protein [Clostridia bacterium]
MELTYRREGDYLLPNLKAPENPRIGKYGMLRLRYLREHKRAILTGLQMTGRLNAHLEQIDREATETVERLTSEMALRQGVNEQMKRTDQMRWVGMMNSLRASAEETVLNELVYR